jgi:hypothetical protein
MIADRWGVTNAEVQQHYPCDDVWSSPAGELWRGDTVEGPPERVWPWVRQIRIAPYSYDWLDNLGRRSPQTIQDLPDPKPGDNFSTAASGPIGRVLTAEPGYQLTATIMGCLMSYVLVPQGEHTRLLLKVLLPRTGPLAALLSIGDLVMARRQLLNLKRLAESSR